jgi:hypothetical protein
MVGTQPHTEEIIFSSCNVRKRTINRVDMENDWHSVSTSSADACGRRRLRDGLVLLPSQG